MTKENIIKKAQDYFDEGYACSQSVLLAYAEKYNIDIEFAKRLSSTFGGGMGRLREKCGAVTGGFMVLGMEYGNVEPKDMDTKLNAYRKVRELNKRITELHETTICGDLLKKHATSQQVEERKHHKIICRKIVGDVAAEVFDLL